MIKGVYNAAGTSKLDVMDGILTIVSDDITNTRIPAGNIFAGAAITPSNGVAQIEGVAFKSMDNEDYADAEMVLLCSPKVALYYELDFRTRYTSLPYNTQMEHPKVQGTNITIREIPEWTGSERIVATPKENLVMLYDDISRTNNILAEREKRNLNLLMDVEAGVNYAIAEIVWTNDRS